MIGLLPIVLAYVVTSVIAMLCIAWAPFAAITCARIARRKGLNANRYAIHGAIYSFILFVPWRHLTRQMRGEPITRANINSAYFFAYLLAGLVVASNIAFVFTITYPSYSLNEFADIVEFIFAAIAGALAFAVGLTSLSLAKNRFNEIQERRESPNAIDLPDRSYIAPFAWAWAAMLICSVPLWKFWFVILDWIISG